MEARKRLKLLVNQTDFTEFSKDIANLTEKDFEDALNSKNSNVAISENFLLLKLLKKIQSTSANIQGSKSS